MNDDLDSFGLVGKMQGCERKADCPGPDDCDPEVEGCCHGEYS